MLAAASMTVHKALLGTKLADTAAISADKPPVSTEAITELPDGTKIIHTAELPGVINGYGGPVPLDIYISGDKIMDIKPLANTETPSFFERASGIVDSWIGRTPEEAVKMKVDAVSGATYSSTAIINNMNVGLDYYLGETNRQDSTVPVKLWIALAVTLAACIVPLCVRSKVYHNVQLIANVVVLGFWCGTFLDYALILKVMADGFMWPVGVVAGVMLIAAFIYPLFGRPQHYCNHICPLGAAQQLVAQICGYKIKLSQKVLKGLDWFRRLLWGVLMLLLWADCLTSWMDLELFQAFQFESASWGIITAACVFVALSAVVARPYCRFVCPTGSLFKRAENMG
ncbi:MAG: FMN-binding protein [Muribaculaceae bacterium]|nr:FMN-binding protein [Muribaculaceae bacterium]